MVRPASDAFDLADNSANDCEIPRSHIALEEEVSGLQIRETVESSHAPVSDSHPATHENEQSSEVLPDTSHPLDQLDYSSLEYDINETQPLDTVDTNPERTQTRARTCQPQPRCCKCTGQCKRRCPCKKAFRSCTSCTIRCTNKPHPQPSPPNPTPPSPSPTHTDTPPVPLPTNTDTPSPDPHIPTDTLEPQQNTNTLSPTIPELPQPPATRTIRDIFIHHFGSAPKRGTSEQHDPNTPADVWAERWHTIAPLRTGYYEPSTQITKQVIALLTVAWNETVNHTSSTAKCLVLQKATLCRDPTVRSTKATAKLLRRRLKDWAEGNHDF